MTKIYVDDHPILDYATATREFKRLGIGLNNKQDINDLTPYEKHIWAVVEINRPVADKYEDYDLFNCKGKEK